MHRRTTGPLAALSLLTSLSLAGPAAPLAAQQDDDRREPSVYTFTSGRPRIGVMVDSRPNAETDKLGARIAEVTPEGPAAKAGLQAGDVITKFNGTALGGLAGEDDDESGPGARLVELARGLDAGDTVQVEYRRDGQAERATIVAQDLGRHDFTVRIPRGGAMPFMERMPFERSEAPHVFQWKEGESPLRVFAGGVMFGGGLELADLNPDLGEYFGAKEGVLVLETPKDSSAQLRAGDVILSIDGRTPTDKAHAHRILASYQAGETAKLEVMRKQRKVTVTWKAAEHGMGRMMMRTPRPAQPGMPSRSKVRVERT